MDLRTVDRSAEKALSEPLLEHSRDEETPNGPVVVHECNVNQEQNGGDSNANDGTVPIAAPFSMKSELSEMASLGIPLIVSFFCRMAMASTDSSFVGHVNDDHYTAETYLAAAVLSDMVLTTCITPPLAFNQVLNALVGQSMGSGNPKMAGIWLQQSCFWLSVTMLPCLFGLFKVEPVLLFLGFSPEISTVAGIYAKYNLIWPIPNGLYQCMRFYFQAQGLPRPAMYNNIIFLFVNAFLNWTFVFGGPLRYFFGWNGFGFIGAAISLSISRTLQSLSYFLYMFVWKQHHKATWPASGWSLSHHTASRTWEFMKQSLPNIGTLLFQVIAGQATTVLVGRLGELPIAASSALSTVTGPWAGSLSATCCTISAVRVGYHLGRGDGVAAQKSTIIVLYFVTAMNIIMAALFLSPLRHLVLDIATNDEAILDLVAKLVPAMLVGTYLSLVVGNITQGVFGGMGRPVIATILSFGLELPLSIGGVALYILAFHGDLLGVYWWQAIAGAIELVIVVAILLRSDWSKCAIEARRRNEGMLTEEVDDNTTPLLNESVEFTTDPESASFDGDARTDADSSIETGSSQ